jgi:hypothetical protein
MSDSWDFIPFYVPFTTTIDDLTETFKRWRADQVKWDQCLREYFDTGGAIWEEVVCIISSDPFEKIVKAKEIVREHSISYQLSSDVKR